MKLCSDEKAAAYIAAREGRPCSVRTVRGYRTREKKRLAATWSGRTWVYQTEAIDEFLEQKRRRAG